MIGLLILFLIALLAVVVLIAAIIAWAAQRPPRFTPGVAIARGRPSDPADTGFDHFEQWNLDRPDGATLPVWEVDLTSYQQTTSDYISDDDSQSSAQELTVIFVHGWGQSRLSMLTRLELWRGLVRRAALYDLRGHGEATGARSRLGHDEHFDLLELIRRLGEGRFVLVGFSMGAVIASHAAAADSDVKQQIAGVIAYGPYVDFHQSLRGRLQHMGYPTRPMTDLAMWWLRVRGIHHRNLIEDAKHLACPLLILHGTADQIAPFSHAEQLVDAAADAALHAVQDADHFELHDMDVEEHRTALRRFVEKIEYSMTRQGV